MTPAMDDRPHTALDLLFGPGEGAPGALAQKILSADADGQLARGLAKLPKVTREAAVREAATAAAGLLDIDLIGMLVAGWRTHDDLTAAARRTLAAPGSTELVDVATHRVTTTQQPQVSVLVDGHRVATLQLGLSVVFDVSALVAGISAGRLTALHSGRCEITATLSIQGTDVATRQAHFELPGVVPLRPPIRLLPASDYPAAGGQPPAVNPAAGPMSPAQQAQPAAQGAPALAVQGAPAPAPAAPPPTAPPPAAPPPAAPPPATAQKKPGPSRPWWQRQWWE